MRRRRGAGPGGMDRERPSDARPVVGLTGAAGGFSSLRRLSSKACAQTLALSYALHYPQLQRQTARGIRHTPFHHVLAARGAYFGESLGWERPAWYAPEGQKPEPELSFGRTKQLAYILDEQRAAREAVGIVDYSPMGKTEVEGRDAEAFLQRTCTNDMAMATVKVVYSLILNESGGIESDVSVTRHSDQRFVVSSSTGRCRRDLTLMLDQIRPGEDVRVRDITTAYSGLSTSAPKAARFFPRSVRTISRTPHSHSIRERPSRSAMPRSGRSGCPTAANWVSNSTCPPILPSMSST